MGEATNIYFTCLKYLGLLGGKKTNFSF